MTAQTADWVRSSRLSFLLSPPPERIHTALNISHFSQQGFLVHGSHLQGRRPGIHITHSGNRGSSSDGSGAEPEACYFKREAYTRTEEAGSDWHSDGVPKTFQMYLLVCSFG